MPGPARIGSHIELKRRVVAEFDRATQQRSAEFIPRPYGECLTLQIGVTTNSGEASACPSKSSSLQSPVRVPPLSKVRKLEELWFLRLRLLRRNDQDITVQFGATLQENLLADGCCPLCKGCDTLIDGRRQVKGTHFGALNPVVQCGHFFCRQCGHSMHGSDDGG